MIKIDVQQGGPEWIKARSGIPTASQFHRLITPKTLKASAQAEGYRNEILAERLLGCSMDDISSEWMERGQAMEESARSWYEWTREVDVERAGFCLRDDRTAGCSPDGLVGEEGGLEIKVPSAAVHVGYLLDGTLPDKYRCQVQGSLWVTGRAWWDFLSYNPSLPSVLIRVERDEEFIAALASAVEALTAELVTAEARLREKIPLREVA